MEKRKREVFNEDNKYVHKRRKMLTDNESNYNNAKLSLIILECDFKRGKVDAETYCAAQNKLNCICI